jgi:hypothetical protein
VAKDRLRGVYGKPLSKAANVRVVLTSEQLLKVGNIIVDSIREEIRTDTAKASGLRAPGEPIPIPNTRRFAESFQVRIRGKSTLEIFSDWPSAEAHVTNPKTPGFVDNSSPQRPRSFQMTWLTRDKVPYARIVRSNGEVIVRMTPDPSQGHKLWRHPGFRKYTFLERGIRKGRDKAIESIAQEVIEGMLSEYDIFGE